MQQKEEAGLKLIPKGLGFEPEDGPKLEGTKAKKDEADEKIKVITDALNDFQSAVTGKGETEPKRATQDERPFLSKIYFIHKLQTEKAIHDSKAMLLSLLADHSTLFSRQFQVYSTDHSYYRDEREKYGTTQKDLLQYCRTHALEIIESTNDRNRYELQLKKIEEAAGRRSCYIEERVSNLLSEGTDIPVDLLLRYRSCVREGRLIKQQTKHYKPDYYEKDYTECLNYLERKKRLEECRGASVQWKFEDYTKVFRSEAEYSTSPGASVEKSGLLAKVFDATKNYFGTEDCKMENVSDIIDCITDLPDVDLALFPFHYLMVCVTGTARLFSTEMTVYGRRVLDICCSPYFKSKPEAVQRVDRIRFLNELNHIWNVDRKNKSRNWNLFLRIHGTQMESPQEVGLWREILYSKSTSADGPMSTQEDIPVIQLSLLCMDYLQSCVPVDYKMLYCYRSCCVMHSGGFHRFLNRYPTVLNQCAERVQRKLPKQDWESCARRYLNEWARLECDIPAIQNLCRDAAKSIRWGGIKVGQDKDRLDQKMEEFCRSCHHQQNVPKDKIYRDVEELKSLLVEAALRMALKSQAENILAKQAEHNLNQNADFKIHLTDFRELAPAKRGGFPQKHI